jgi:hypothetical protein
MNTLFLKFEAIESRIASYSCPRGVPGRVNALRLRRCFQNNSRRQSTAVGERLPAHEIESRIEPTQETAEEKRDTVGRVGITGQNGESHENEDTQIPKAPRIRPVATAKFDSAIHNATITRRRLKRRFGQGFGPQMQGDMFRPPLNEDGNNELAKDEAGLYSALRTGSPHAVFMALSDHAKSVGFLNTCSFLNSIPPATFSELLRCLDPKHFVGRYQELHREISPRLAQQLGILGAIDLQRGYYKFCTLFLEHVKGILDARHYEYPATLSDYKYLLKCARATGNRDLAEYIWHTMTAQRMDGKGTDVLSPDAECYNCYLSIKCWHDSTNPLLRFRLRIIPDNFAPRGWNKLPYDLKGHSVGGESGIRAQVTLLFRQMVEAGISGNEETFCLMMVSMAREGDMSAVASILRRVWNIDVEQLLNSNDSKLPPAKSYKPDSPFHPTDILLYTIAHAFGVNNQIPIALRLVDYISGQYAVPIPTNVWNELLRWTFVLSTEPQTRKRNNEPVDTGKEIGQLPPEAVTSLWDTMVSKPYNVKPTMEMYNRLITNLYYRQKYREMQIRMEEARRLLKEAVRKLSHMQAIFYATTRYPSPVHLAERRMRDLLLARLRVRRNRKYAERWVRLLIKHGSQSLKYTDGWSDQNLPNIIKDWSLFLPEMLHYPIRSGEVSFKSGSKKQRISSYWGKIERNPRLVMRGLRIRKHKAFSSETNVKSQRLNMGEEERGNADVFG